MNLLKLKFYLKNNGIDMEILSSFLSLTALPIITSILFLTTKIYEFAMLYVISLFLNIAFALSFMDDVKRFYNKSLYYININLKIKRIKNNSISLDTLNKIKNIIENYNGCDKND